MRSTSRLAHWCYNLLVLSQLITLPAVSYSILLSHICHLKPAEATWHETDRNILLEILITAAFLNSAFQPISRLIHLACQVCLLNPLNAHVAINILLPVTLHALLILTVILMWMYCVFEDVGCVVELQIGYPQLMSGHTALWVIDTQITHVHKYALCVTSQHSVNNIMEMQHGFWRFLCLS